MFSPASFLYLRLSSPSYVQSFQFLVDVSEFQSTLHAAQSNQKREECFEEFLAVVSAYIKDNSNSEINLSSRTKKEILRFEGRSSYAALDMVRQGMKNPLFFYLVCFDVWFGVESSTSIHAICGEKALTLDWGLDQCYSLVACSQNY